MFTGIVEELGQVIAHDDAGALRISAGEVLAGLDIGDSVAVNGCCLTATEVADGTFSATAVPETLARTNLGGLRPGDRVNLERPLRLNGRLDGHMVQGHVDGTGTVVRAAPDLMVEADSGLLAYLVEKGSITVDGVSLTVVEVSAAGFSVAVIPHTADVTTLGVRQPGDLVNLEVDVIAKYVERLLPRTGRIGG